MSTKNNRIDMVNGPLFKNIMLFSLPVMATNLLQMCFNAADTIVVGKFAGQIPLAAVGATGSLIYMFTSMFQGIGTGVNVVIARQLGANEDEEVSKTAHTSILMAIISSLFLVVAGIILARPLLQLMSTPDNIIDLSVLYMRIYFLGAPGIVIYNFGSGILRAKGDTKRPMYFLSAAGILNVLLNLFFVIVLHMSVAGVAIATVSSNCVSSACLIWCLLHDQDATRIVPSKLKIDKEKMLHVLRIGIPAGLQGMAFSLTNVVVQSSINSFDSSVIVAGNTAAANIENFIYIGMIAFSQAAVTFISQCVGAKKKERIRKIIFDTMILDCVSAFAIGFAAYKFGNVLLGFYTDDPEVVSAGMFRLYYIGVFLWLNGALDILGSSMRGLGYSTFPALVMFVGIIGVRLLWLSTVFPVYRTLETIYLCFPLSWLVTDIIDAVALYIIYKKVMKSM